MPSSIATVLLFGALALATAGLALFWTGLLVIAAFIWEIIVGWPS